MKQKVIKTNGNYTELECFLQENNIRSIFLVCGKNVLKINIGKYFYSIKKRLKIDVIVFDDFKPNPVYESAIKGVELFHKSKCDIIIAVGGGSAIDIAKCIKLFSNMDSKRAYLDQPIIPNDIMLVAIPTTAGTGSESTRFAVIYYKGEKQSISDESCIPSIVMMDASVLKTLPEYQKKSTMMDAFCHALESFWSINSTKDSQEFSKKAIRMILKNRKSYLANDETGNANMLEAANIAGKAINIAQTTAGHAMCYKLTSIYGIAHGHAAAICIAKLWSYMVANIEKCIDPRGQKYLQKVFNEIAKTMGCANIEEAIQLYNKILFELELFAPNLNNEQEFDILKNSVNIVRLKNNPIELDKKAIDILYHQILK